MKCSGPSRRTSDRVSVNVAAKRKSSFKYHAQYLLVVWPASPSRLYDILSQLKTDKEKKGEEEEKKKILLFGSSKSGVKGS